MGVSTEFANIVRVSNAVHFTFRHSCWRQHEELLGKSSNSMMYAFRKWETDSCALQRKGSFDVRSLG